MFCNHVSFSVTCHYIDHYELSIKKDVVMLLISGAKRVVQLSLRSTETGHQFITTNLIYYNCSVLNS